MRKLLLSSVAATAMVLAAEAARADEPAAPGRHWYATLFAGGAFPEDVGFTHEPFIYNTDLRTGFTVGGAIGTEVLPGLRGELEFSYQRYTADDYTGYAGQPVAGFAGGPANLYFFLANLWKDFDLGMGVTPYVGGGIGLGIADVNIEVFIPPEPDINDSGVGLAAQLGAGIKVPIFDNISLDFSYRFKALVGTTLLGDRSDADNHAKASFYTHLVQAGIVFDFGGPKSSDVRSLSAAGGEDWYVSLFGGVVLPEDIGFVLYSGVYNIRAKTGFTVGSAIGTQIAEGLRGELEFSYANYSGKDYTYFRGAPPSPITGDVDLYYILANLWKDVNIGHNLMPYVGGGLGIGLVSSNLNQNFEKDDTDIGLAGQFGVGVRYVTDSPWTIDAGYRFKGIVDVTLDGNDAIFAPHQKASFYTHTLQIGATYNFGDAHRVEPAADDDPASNEWYVSLFGGGVVPEDSGFTSFGYIDNVDFDTGFTIGVAVGAEVAEGLRGELEFSYLSYAADDYTYFRTQPPVPASGDADLYFVLANLWKDFDLGNGFVPYIGGGIGIGVADVDVFPFVPTDDVAVGLAGQLGAGVRFKITENLTADAGYRFKGILDTTLRGDPAFAAPHSKASFLSHSLIGGVSYGF